MTGLPQKKIDLRNLESTGDFVSFFQIINDVSEDRLFTFIARIYFHVNGNLIRIKKKSHSNDGFFSVFLV